MTTQHYSNISDAKLSDYISSQRFRTVTSKQFKLPCGISEIPVEIEVKQKFAESLSFKTSSSGIIYGFVRTNALLKELDTETDDNIQLISLHDWDNKFLMVIETKSKGELAFNVLSEDVKELLENCVRIPEQK